MGEAAGLGVGAAGEGDCNAVAVRGDERVGDAREEGVREAESLDACVAMPEAVKEEDWVESAAPDPLCAGVVEVVREAGAVPRDVGVAAAPKDAVATSRGEAVT